MSSINSSLNIAVSALSAQSKAVSTISNNLANSETVGYKTTDASFASLVTSSGSAQHFTGAGTQVTPSQNLSEQGLLQSTGSTTDLAIDGDGFFVVSDGPDSGKQLYTRVGDFQPDADGYLVNANGYYLQGYPTDPDGTVNTGITMLEPLNLDSQTGTAVATSQLAINGNLPANAEMGASVDTEVEIYDSLGVAHAVGLTYTKTGVNQWSLAAKDPVLAADGTTVSGTANGGGTITFNDDGTVASTVPGDLTIAVTGWSSGASDSTIAYDAGLAGSASGLSQFSGDDPDQMTIRSVDQDGVWYGDFYNTTIDADGLVYANYDNGVSQALYQIPLATFINPDGLEAVSGNAYGSTALSGAQTLVDPGEAGAGTIQSAALESSTVDTAEEFSKLIVAQQAYAAASEIISTAQEMFDNLMRAKS